MKFVKIFMILLTSQLGESVIYRLNDTEYLKMPPIYHLDDYYSCIYQTNGTYCYVDMDLVSDTPSDLLNMIREYSEHRSSHFNHTQLRYGICLTTTCKYFIQNDKAIDKKLVLEGCLNQSLWRNYQLKTIISNNVYCKRLDDPIAINIGDICAAVVFVSLALLNVAGSLFDIVFNNGSTGNRFILCFSIKQNWKKLVAPVNIDPFRERLKGLYGARALAIMMVIFAHSPLSLVLSTENCHELEKTYDNIAYHLYFNGTLIVQIFFVMTGCLMAYAIRTYSENNKLSWVVIPIAILKRWLRLTPAYAVVLLFTLTWIRFIGSGPLWEVAVGVEVRDCQRDWWWNIIYLNNYIDNSQCMAQTWFLAANMQLCILGIFVCILADTPKKRNIVLSVLFIVGCVTPSIHTYLQDLDAIILMAPQIARNFFVTDPTFNHSYKRGHTNIPSMVLGIALGNLIYEGLRDETRMKKYKRLGFLYHLTVPTAVALLLSGIVFYGDRPRMSIYLRTVIAGVVRPFFSIIVTIFTIGMVFKFENVYRRVLEWRGWITLARVSYSAFLIHVSIIRVFAGINSTLVRAGIAQYAKEASGMILMTFLLAYPFWLFVEAPLNQAILIILRLSREDGVNRKVNSTPEKIFEDTDYNEVETKIDNS